MFWECTRLLGHDVVDGNVCSNVGFIQGKLRKAALLLQGEADISVG
jgi:hypothetical protein